MHVREPIENVGNDCIADWSNLNPDGIRDGGEHPQPKAPCHGSFRQLLLKSGLIPDVHFRDGFLDLTGA